MTDEERLRRLDAIQLEAEKQTRIQERIAVACESLLELVQDQRLSKDEKRRRGLL